MGWLLRIAFKSALHSWLVLIFRRVLIRLSPWAGRERMGHFHIRLRVHVHCSSVQKKPPCLGAFCFSRSFGVFRHHPSLYNPPPLRTRTIIMTIRLRLLLKLLRDIKLSQYTEMLPSSVTTIHKTVNPYPKSIWDIFKVRTSRIGAFVQSAHI